MSSPSVIIGGRVAAVARRSNSAYSACSTIHPATFCESTCSMPTAYGYGPTAPRSAHFSSCIPPLHIIGPIRRAHGSNVFVMYEPHSVEPM